MVRGRIVLATASLLLAMAAPRAVAEDGPSATQRAAIIAKSSVVCVIGAYEVSFRVGGDTVREVLGGMGSGFFASADGYIVTNAHVVDDIKAGDEVAKAKAFSQLAAKIQKQYAKELAQMTDEQKIQLVRQLQDSAVATPIAEVILSDGTKLKYKVVSFGRPGMGDDVAVIKVDVKDAPNLVVADSDRVMVQDRVLAIGYPGAADMEDTFDAKSQLEATINEGAVSAIKRTGDGNPIIQISASITHGNSGGPTVNDHGEVIGLSTFGTKGEIQGFNFIVASATVKKFLTEAKVNLAPSQSMKLWVKGLNELWTLDLDSAIADMEEVMTLYPMHSEAPRMLKQARALKKEGKGKPPPAPPATGSNAAGSGSATSTNSSGFGGGGGDDGSGAGVAVAVLLVLAGVIGGVVVFMRRKKAAVGPQMARPPGMQPPHGMPPQGYGAPPQPHGGPMMVPGRSGPQQPVAKTVAIQQNAPGASQPIAATAFGSMTVGVLTCTRGRLQGQRFSLTTQGLLIGRQPGLAQIVLDDPRSSGKHVWIGYEQGQLVAIDQGTTNGTFVNDVRFGRISKAVLKDGDTVIVSEPDCLSLTLKLG